MADQGTSGPGPPLLRDQPATGEPTTGQATMELQLGQSLTPMEITSRHHLEQDKFTDERQRQRDEEMRERQRRRKLDTKKIRRVTRLRKTTDEEDGYDSDTASAVSSDQQEEPDVTNHPLTDMDAAEGAAADNQEGTPMDANPPEQDDDDAEYQQPKGKKRISQKAARERVEEKRRRLQLELSNQYETLSEREDENPPARREPPRRREVTKVPCIFIKTTNYIKMNFEIKKIIQGSLRATFRGDNIKYQFDTMADYETTFKFCQDNQIPFFTHQKAENREKKIVIKGLPPEAVVDDIKADLEQKGFRVSLVHQYKKRDPHSKRLKPKATFTAVLPKDQKWEAIYDVQYILLTKVTIEDYESRDGPPQCKRCLRWDHTTNYCWMPVRCIKCGGNHDRRECTLKDSDPAKCAGCKGAHPASWKGCPEYQRALRTYRPSQQTASGQRKQSTKATAEQGPKLIFATQPGPSTRQDDDHQPRLPQRAETRRTTGRLFADAVAGRQGRSPTETTRANFWDLAAKLLGTFLPETTVDYLISTGRRFFAAPDIMTKVMVLIEAATHLLA